MTNLKPSTQLIFTSLHGFFFSFVFFSIFVRFLPNLHALSLTVAERSIETTNPRWRLSAWLAVSEVQFLSNFWLVPRGRRALQWAQVRISPDPDLDRGTVIENFSGATPSVWPTSVVILTGSTKVTLSRWELVNLLLATNLCFSACFLLVLCPLFHLCQVFTLQVNLY